MTTHEIPVRYAQALYSVEPDNQELKEDLLWLGHLFSKVPTLLRLLQAPQIHKKRKKEILEKCLANKVSPVLKNLLTILLEKGRIKYIPQIAEIYEKMVQQKLGVETVTLITTQPLDSQRKELLKNKLEKSSSKKIAFKEVSDPQIIGGMVLISGHRMYDGSIKSRIAKLKEELMGITI